MTEADLGVCVGHTFFRPCLCLRLRRHRTIGRHTAGDLGSNARADGISDISGHLPGVGKAVAVAVLAISAMVLVEGRRRQRGAILCSIKAFSWSERRIDDRRPSHRKCPLVNPPAHSRPSSYYTALIRISYPAPYTPIAASPPPRPSTLLAINDDQPRSKPDNQAETDLYIPPIPNQTLHHRHRLLPSPNLTSHLTQHPDNQATSYPSSCTPV